MLVSVHGTQGYETPPETPESFEAPEGSETAEGSEGSQGFETPQGYEIPQCYETTAMSQEANQLSDDEIVRSWRFLLQEISTWIGTHLNGAAISDPNLLPAGLQDWMGGYGYIWLSYGHPPRFVIEKVLWSWLDATIFNKYFFGIPAELDEQLHDLEETMAQDESPLVVAKWRANIIAVLHRDPELCMAVGNDLVGLVDVFEDLILPFTENLRWGVNDDYARKESLLNIVSTAVDLHYALRQKFPMYELTFLELSTHGNCDLFDPTLMKDASREYTPKMVTENVADAFLFEDLFRDARNKRAELENVRMRQERKEALEGEEVVRVSQEITMERSREDRVSFFVTPALRKMELDGTVKVLGKVKVFVGI